MITIDDFAKVELKVGTVLSCIRIEGSEKLLCLEVDLGSQRRMILSGIAQYYKEDDLIGKQVVVVTNLSYRKMMGIESQGMILTAGDEKPILLTPESYVKEGSVIR